MMNRGHVGSNRDGDRERERERRVALLLLQALHHEGEGIWVLDLFFRVKGTPARDLEFPKNCGFQ